VYKLFQSINKKKITVSAIVITFAFSLGIINTDFGLKGAFAQPIVVPKVSLVYNGGITDLTPFINVKDTVLTKINTPKLEPSEDSVIYTIHKGDKISFNFEKAPARVDAFLVDYEANLNTVYALQRSGEAEFIADVPTPGLFNVEVHALYPDGRYTSYTKLIKVANDNVNLLDLVPSNNRCGDELKLNKVWAEGNVENLVKAGLNQSLFKDISLGVENELYVELAKNDMVCGLQMGLANSDNGINFFAIQIKGGGQYDDPIVFSNTGFGGSQEIYRYPPVSGADGMKVIPLGSTPEKGLGVQDIKVLGS
jgi:hypothetical protein